MEALPFVNINLDHIEEGLQLIIDEKHEGTLFFDPDAKEHGEACYQLKEGCSYDYSIMLNDKLAKSYYLEQESYIVPHKRNQCTGTISPNIFVGTLGLYLKNETDPEFSKELFIEVQSIKSGYRDDYRDMLEFITEKCTDLIMQANSPVTHNFESDFERDNNTLYQKFAFIKSIIATDEFAESVHRIVSSPVTKWKEEEEQKDIRNIRRFKNSNIKELITGSNRTKLPNEHYLQQYGLTSLPSKITAIKKSDTVDTPENRFVKFALESFLKFCSDINRNAKQGSRLWKESGVIERELESFLYHSIFKEISHPETLKLNSSVLQRKEGYREVLRVWLMFDIAAKLIWQGGDDVYKAGKKDIATLYEYWLFFKLLDLFKSIFEIEPKEVEDLIEKTNGDLNLRLKQGEHTALKGVFDTGTRKLTVRFNYNKSFSGKKEYPNSGSWTTTMRPDYTLSFWPHGITKDMAEEQELIVHIHFDAKYKVANLKDILDTENQDLEEEKKDNRKGIYKNADLLKMHAYKDAIRRTGGAYVLYPGDTSVMKRGFHEIIPGLGAFPVSPSKMNDGISELKDFIIEVINHFINRASQREKIAYNTYDVYKNKPQKEDEVNELLPETYGENRNLIPDNTYVLVGYYHKENLDWIVKSGLYNARTGSKRGSLKLGLGEATAKYLLLHTEKETKTSRIFRIIESGPKVYSKQTLINKDYPSEPSQDYYLVYKIKEVIETELLNRIWDITKLDRYKPGQGSALPFAVSLSELMKVKI